jgi:Fe2+ transport system protein FeoA
VSSNQVTGALPLARALSSVPVGTTGALQLGTLPRGQGLRLAQLGLRSGAAVVVLARTSGGGRVVGVGTTRVGLDRTTSRHLHLQVAGQAA